MKTRSRSSARIAAHKLLSPAKQDCSASADGRTRFFLVYPATLVKVPDHTTNGGLHVSAKSTGGRRKIGCDRQVCFKSGVLKQRERVRLPCTSRAIYNLSIQIYPSIITILYPLHPRIQTNTLYKMHKKFFQNSPLKPSFLFSPVCPFWLSTFFIHMSTAHFARFLWFYTDLSTLSTR